MNINGDVFNMYEPITFICIWETTIILVFCINWRPIDVLGKTAYTCINGRWLILVIQNKKMSP